jgi:hypothetical protein
MEEIENVVKHAGHHVRRATCRGKRVRADNAYDADHLSEPLPLDAQRVFVECEVRGLRADVIVDHHRPGDPGFSLPAEQYLLGSSLGQVLALLHLEPTEQQCIIAAADHCPTQAYQGRCPGVCPLALTTWRTSSRAARRGITAQEMDAAIEAGKRYLLEEAVKVSFCGHQFPWVQGRARLEIAEASARYSVPFMYAEQPRHGKVKLGIMGAAPDVIDAWMQDCGLEKVYGNPSRGYAGGYALA